MKIVLLPGLDGTGILFKPLLESLPPDIEPLVIAYPNDRKLNYHELADFVMKEIPKDEAFILLGESFSGPIAYDIALRNPPGLSFVIFVASFLNAPRNPLLGLLRFPPLSFLLSMPVPGFMVKSLLLGSGYSARLHALLKESLSKVPVSILSFRLGEIARLRKQHKHCNIRTIYIQATADKLVSASCAGGFREIMDDLSVYKVDGPHFILQTNPSACVKIIASEALRKNSAGGR